MPVDERTRRIMTEGLVRTLGEEVTDALLAHLPPVGWADVATKQDLAHVEQRFESRLDQLEAHIDAKLERLEGRFHRELAKQTRLYVASLVLTVVAVAGLT